MGCFVLTILNSTVHPWYKIRRLWKRNSNTHKHIWNYNFNSTFFMESKSWGYLSESKSRRKNIRLLIEKDQYIAKMTSRKMHKNWGKEITKGIRTEEQSLQTEKAYWIQSLQLWGTDREPPTQRCSSWNSCLNPLLPG